MTVAKYLTQRLHQLGIRHAFGVPGDYVLDFLDVVIDEGIEWVGTCNELNSAYAADGYARLNGLGLSVVTYGVGSLSALNGIAGAYAEEVPVVIIAGTAHSKYRKKNDAALHHLTGDHDAGRKIFKEVTVAQAILSDPEEAPRQIDAALQAALTHSRPVYIEIPQDLVNVPCPALSPELPAAESFASEPAALAEAVQQAAELLNQAKNPVVLGGVQLHRFGLIDAFERFIESSKLPFATSLDGKSLLAETHPQYAGIYCGVLSQPQLQTYVEGADVLLRVGTIDNDISSGIYTAKLPAKLITATAREVRINGKVYKVALGDFITKLQDQLKAQPADLQQLENLRGTKSDYTAQKGRKLEVARFYERINGFLTKEMTLVSDAGDALFASADFQVQRPQGFVSQSHYLSIGFGLPATLGASLARPKERTALLIGDGCFQMTAQELSSILRSGTPTVVFLLNNDGYVIERLIHDGPYNDIQRWNYDALPKAFNGMDCGIKVSTEDELEDALKRIEQEPNSPFLVNVILPPDQACDALVRLGTEIRRAAEAAS